MYRCTMTYNMKPCIALFLEAEYEALTVEDYWKSRLITTRLDNERYLFSCIHYNKTHLSKNMTFYHRVFNLCNVYKGPGVLKMYPVWEKSNLPNYNYVFNGRVEHLKRLHRMLAYHALMCDRTMTLCPLRVM